MFTSTHVNPTAIKSLWESSLTHYQLLKQKYLLAWGSGCGSVGRAVDFYTRSPRYESSHWQISIITVDC